MRKFYGPPIPGSISPVPATEEMTEPVGIKDGQLWTKGPDGGLEERVETLETDVGNLQETATEHGTAINNLEIDMTDAENDISGLQNRMTAAESNIGTNAQEIGQLQFDVSQAQTDIVGLGLSKLDKPTNEGETGDVIVKTAGGTEFQSVAPFNPNGTYPNVTAGKAISAKSLENISEDSGATQTEPFFFQATATANGTEETPTAPVFELKSIRGNTIVYNQLVDGFSTTYDTISGHKYWAFHVGQPPVIVTSQGTPISFPSPQSDKLVDLTRWFNGSIPQAILDDPSVFPINYYDGELTYSAGELKNCSCTELKTVGFNALKTQPTAFVNVPAFNADIVTRVFPDKTYHLKYTATGTGRIYIVSYDLNGNLLGKKNVDGGPFYYNSAGYDKYGNDLNREENFKFLYPSYILIFYSTFDSFTDCNLNIKWDGERDGEYEPYISHTYPLVWSGKSAYGAYDERLPDGTEITRIEEMTFDGSESWSSYDSAGTGYTGVRVNFVNLGYTVGSGRMNVINNLWFIPRSSPSGSTDYSITQIDNVLYVVFPQSLFADVNAWKAYLVDHPFVVYHEIALTTSEGTPYTSEIEGDDYGTMSFDSVVPVGNEFFYPADYALLIDDLGNYTGYDVTKLMLKTDNVVPSAPTSDGTYVLKCVVSGGTPSYSWIAET